MFIICLCSWLYPSFRAAQVVVPGKMMLLGRDSVDLEEGPDRGCLVVERANFSLDLACKASFSGVCSVSGSLTNSLCSLSP